jgi:[ribosomal protein S5]-alanine N-acetyltransferase
VTSDLVVFDADYPDVQLVPFALKRDDRELHKAYLGWLNDLDVVRLIASPALMSTNKDMTFIEDSFNRFTQPGCRAFFIYYAPDNAFIGTTKLDSISTHTRSAWDGIMIGDKRYFGRGLSSRVYRVLLAYGFRELGFNRVSGGCNEKNTPMVRTFKRLGYTPEGRLRQADCIDGEFCDHLYFGILRDEFFAANPLNLKTKTS